MEKRKLEDNLNQINSLISKHNSDADQFKSKFKAGELSNPMKHLSNYQDFELK